MATKEYQDKASPAQKGSQSQQNKSGKESKDSTASANSCATDQEQQASSNKGKGPAGENL